jgi:hypothetical protein
VDLVVSPSSIVWPSPHAAAARASPPCRHPRSTSPVSSYLFPSRCSASLLLTGRLHHFNQENLIEIMDGLRTKSLFWKREALLISRLLHQGDTTSWNPLASAWRHTTHGHQNVQGTLMTIYTKIRLPLICLKLLGHHRQVPRSRFNDLLWRRLLRDSPCTGQNHCVSFWNIQAQHRNNNL